MVSKLDLDLRVAVELGTSQRKVTKITTRFLEEMRSALVNDGEVVLQGLGRLKVQTYDLSAHPVTLIKGTYKKGRRAGKIRVEKPRHIKVFFRKAPALRDALKRGKQ